jgi:elongator complex protein 3
MPSFTSSNLSYKSGGNSVLPSAAHSGTSAKQKVKNKNKEPKKPTSKVNDATAFVSAVSEIVAQLIKVYEEGKVVNLTSLKSKYSAKYNLPEQPKTVDIISAIPEQYKDSLLPILKQKPIRTASGVRSRLIFLTLCL